jgi:hypothetical protein
MALCDAFFGWLCCDTCWAMYSGLRARKLHFRATIGHLLEKQPLLGSLVAIAIGSALPFIVHAV